MEDIRRHRYENGKPRLRRFHQARWDEPIIFELSRRGQRGILVPDVEEEVRALEHGGLDPLSLPISIMA